jgi:hypothetical protein
MRVAPSFGLRFDFLRKPPVDMVVFIGDVEVVLDRVSEVSVCAGDTCRCGDNGGSNTALQGGETVRPVPGFSLTIFDDLSRVTDALDLFGLDVVDSSSCTSTTGRS